jgi:hypothetical protein
MIAHPDMQALLKMMILILTPAPHVWAKVARCSIPCDL